MFNVERKISMKRNYIQPEVTVAQVALDSMILAGSPGAAPSMGINIDPTDDQW